MSIVALVGLIDGLLSVAQKLGAGKKVQKWIEKLAILRENSEALDDLQELLLEVQAFLSPALSELGETISTELSARRARAKKAIALNPAFFKSPKKGVVPK